eukprot:12913222-Prorocentrum_lima.AAC.1
MVASSSTAPTSRPYRTMSFGWPMAGHFCAACTRSCAPSSRARANRETLQLETAVPEPSVDRIRR